MIAPKTSLCLLFTVYSRALQINMTSSPFKRLRNRCSRHHHLSVPPPPPRQHGSRPLHHLESLPRRSLLRRRHPKQPPSLLHPLPRPPSLLDYLPTSLDTTPQHLPSSNHHVTKPLPPHTLHPCLLLITSIHHPLPRQQHRRHPPPSPFL